MVALLTPALSATASMLTAPNPRSRSSSAAASRIACRAFSLRGRPRLGVSALASLSTFALPGCERRLALRVFVLARCRLAEAGEVNGARRRRARPRTAVLGRATSSRPETGAHVVAGGPLGLTDVLLPGGDGEVPH